MNIAQKDLDQRVQKKAVLDAEAMSKVNAYAAKGIPVPKAIQFVTIGEDYEQLTADERWARFMEFENRHSPKRVLLPELIPPRPRKDEMHLWLGRRLREARSFGQLTQRELARAAGMSQASISRIEKGLKSPTYVEVSRLAKLLAKKPEDFTKPWPED